MPASCPLCKQPVAAEPGTSPKWFPFCTERCRQIDLLRWSKGEYAIVEQLTPEAIAQKLAEGEAGEDGKVA